MVQTFFQLWKKTKRNNIGDQCTAEPKKRIFRFNPGKPLNLFPPKHPYYKVPQEVKQMVEKMAVREEAKQIREGGAEAKHPRLVALLPHAEAMLLQKVKYCRLSCRCQQKYIPLR